MLLLPQNAVYYSKQRNAVITQLRNYIVARLVYYSKQRNAVITQHDGRCVDGYPIIANKEMRS